LLGYGGWSSFFNGLTQAPQGIFPKRVLDVGLAMQAEMRTTMQLGQAGLSWWVGRAADRWGNVPVLVASQLIVSTGALFFLPATRDEPRWLFGAWVVWSGYVGINVCAPNLALKLAGSSSAAYLATYFALSSICYAASTVLGGWLFNQLPDPTAQVFAGWTAYQWIFLFGWASRSLGVVWLLSIDERELEAGR